ncbi:MAG: hypothetical protein R2709_09865 [Marmoricola sp.]
MRELLQTVADYPRRVELAIETKHPTRYGATWSSSGSLSWCADSAGTRPAHQCE